MCRYEGRLARALAGVINILDPAALVLGGGLSNLDRLYRSLPERLPRHVFSDHVATLVLTAQHGDSSGVFGAARLWRPEELPQALAAASCVMPGLCPDYLETFAEPPGRSAATQYEIQTIKH